MGTDQELVVALMHKAALFLEVLGIAAIVVGVLYALLRAATGLARRHDEGDIYGRLRHRVGRAILLSLEFLVAADIIGTVAVEPTIENLAVLGLIVLIRTFLSFTLEVELDGRWPWQGSRKGKGNG